MVNNANGLQKVLVSHMYKKEQRIWYGFMSAVQILAADK